MAKCPHTMKIKGNDGIMRCGDCGRVLDGEIHATMTHRDRAALTELSKVSMEPASFLSALPQTLGRLRTIGYADRIYDADRDAPPLWFITDAGRAALTVS